MWSNGWGKGPESQIVQTGAEAAKPYWDAFKSSIEDSSEARNDLLAGIRGDVAAAYSAMPTFSAAGMKAAQDFYTSNAFLGTLGDDARMDLGLAWSPMRSVEASDVGGPDYQSRDKALEIEQRFRDDARRQSGAYGEMQGGNYFGGMLTEDYSTPAFGSIGVGRVGGLGGLGGMQTANPSNFPSYNSTWQPNDPQQFRAGSWGTPFGGW